MDDPVATICRGGRRRSAAGAAGPRRSAGGVLGVGLDRGVVGLELLGLDLLGPAHRLLDPGPHVGDDDHDQAGLAGVQVLAQLLEVAAAHAGGVPGHRAQHSPAGGGGQQPGLDPGEREQGDDQVQPALRAGRAFAGIKTPKRAARRTCG
jgi:hypothetical protein